MVVAVCHPSGDYEFEVALRFSENLCNTVVYHMGFKAQWSLYVPPALTFRNSVFLPNGIYVFCVDL